MKLSKHKQQPFYVKRIRLKQSVQKTHQILQSMSLSEHPNHYMHHTMRESTRNGDYSLKRKVDKGPRMNQSIDSSQFYRGKAPTINSVRMQQLIKVCRTKKNLEKGVDPNSLGIEVRQLVADPKWKKDSPKNEKEPKCKSSNVFRNFRSTQYCTLEQKRKLMVSSDGFHHLTDQGNELVDEKISSGIIESNPNRNSLNKRSRLYLYERLANSENADRDQTNQIYEKRIKSYTEFLWKCMLAHSVYFSLDLKSPQLSVKKNKAFVGYGNNCNMIKGLIKRRFWWALSEQLTDDCLFVWTQLKVGKIFEKQEEAPKKLAQYVISLDEVEDKKRISKTCFPVKRKVTQKSQEKSNQQKFQEEYTHYKKIFTQQDKNAFESFFYKFFCEKFQLSKRVKEPSYSLKTKQVSSSHKKIKMIDNLGSLETSEPARQHNFYRVKPIVHNHFEQNFHLGNKKALFYNMRQYYTEQNKDIFTYLPLTFHIKEGLNDPAYKSFVSYYEERQKQIKRQEKQEGLSKMTRNIWIVKPGQNSNQGQGITVIDQIYELNHIIKQSQSRPKQTKGKAKDEKAKTFIVQQYIDRPFLFNDRKFDIRHYMLITNLYGVFRAYWYEEGYIRTSSYHFNINNFEPEIHLTNDAIQKQYPQYGKYEPYNKVSYSEFQSYLNSFPQKQYDFKKQIIPQMKTIGRHAAKSVFQKLAPKNQMNNFQIFGLDFMIDRHFKPWLIEVNTNPCLDCSCPLLNRIIPYMVQQSLKLSLDLVYPPPCHYPNTSKHYAPYVNLANFKYELVFDSTEEIDSLNTQAKEQNNSIMTEIGEIADDEEFNDNGKQIKLQDYT